jgi:hypothetical protein
MKIKVVQATGVVSNGTGFINLAGNQIAVVEDDGKIVALLGPENDSLCMLQAETILRALQGAPTRSPDQLVGVIRVEQKGWLQVSTQLADASRALVVAAEYANNRAKSLLAVIVEAEQPS